MFLYEQGIGLKKNILFQDNISTILLEKKGRVAAGKRLRAINIRYFAIKDHVEKGDSEIEYCPTNLVIGDFLSKPLQGKRFQKFRELLLGM